MIDAAQLDPLKARIKAILADDLSLARVREDKDGDLVFSYEKGGYLLVFHPNDPSFIRLLAPCFYSVDAGDDAGLGKAQRTALHVSSKVKGVKIISGCLGGHDDYDFSASVEPLLSDIDSLDADLFERYLSMIKSGLHDFCEMMQSPTHFDTPQVDVPAPELH